MNFHRSKIISNQFSFISNQFSSDIAKALFLYFDDHYNIHDNYDNDARYRRNNYRDNDRDNEFRGHEYDDHYHRHDNDHTHDHESKERQKNNKSSYNPNKFYTHYQIIDHDIFIYKKFVKQQEKNKKSNAGNENNENKENNDSHRIQYQSSYIQDPYHYSTNILNLIA